MSASNTLYRGEAADFLTAISLARQAVCEERRSLFALPKADFIEANAELDRYADRLHAAEKRYRQLLSAMERKLAAELAMNSNEEDKLIGEALRTGDYTKLAI